MRTSIDYDWRSRSKWSKHGRRLNARLFLNYDILFLTRSVHVEESKRADESVVRSYLQLEESENLESCNRLPRGMSSDFKSDYTYVIYIHHVNLSYGDFVALLAHEISHVVDYIEANAEAKFCSETRAYITEEVMALAVEVLDF